MLNPKKKGVWKGERPQSEGMWTGEIQEGGVDEKGVLGKGTKKKKTGGGDEHQPLSQTFMKEKDTLPHLGKTRGHGKTKHVPSHQKLSGVKWTKKA